MKLASNCCILSAALLVGVPVQAVEPMAPYDDFKGKTFDASKWLGQQSGSLLDVAREIHGNRVHLVARSPALAGHFGSVASRLRLTFANPAAVEAIEARAHIRKVEASGCTGNPSPTRVSLRVLGFFFNSGIVEPAPGNGVDDVFALVRAERSTANNDPEGVMRVQALVLRCNDPNCVLVNVLGGESLGFLSAEQKIRLRMQWDDLGNQFIFQRDDELEVYVPYPGTLNRHPPGIQLKSIEIALDPANCTVAGTSIAFMEAFVDKVLVNESAALRP